MKLNFTMKGQKNGKQYFANNIMKQYFETTFCKQHFETIFCKLKTHIFLVLGRLHLKKKSPCLLGGLAETQISRGTNFQNRSAHFVESCRKKCSFRGKFPDFLPNLRSWILRFHKSPVEFPVGRKLFARHSGLFPNLMLHVTN